MHNQYEPVFRYNQEYHTVSGFLSIDVDSLMFMCIPYMNYNTKGHLQII